MDGLNPGMMCQLADKDSGHKDSGQMAGNHSEQQINPLFTKAYVYDGEHGFVTVMSHVTLVN